MRAWFLPLLAACGGDVDGPDVVLDPDVVTSTARPDGRSEVLTAVDPVSGAILTFGGNDGPIVDQRARSAFRNDTWLFTPGVGWEEVVVDGPSARGRYGMAYDPTGGRALLFGGRFRKADETGDYRVLNDLWSFDFASKTWSEVDTGGGKPPGRYYPAMGWDDAGQALYVMGGALNEDALVIEPALDLWRWTAADGWTELPTSETAPSLRTFFGSTWDPATSTFYLFGGQVGDFSSSAFQDTWALHAPSGTWTELDDGDDKAPSTRMHAGLLWDDAGQQLVLFGGHTDIGDGNDVWTFRPSAPGWNKVLQGDKFDDTELGCLGNPAEVPADYVTQDLSSPERRHRGFLAIQGGSMWVSSGMHSECSAYLDDVWRFDLAAATWTEVIEARTGESCARRGDACECLCL